MADVTELRGWPLCVDAIDWSPEGILALASDETVELLFPNTVSFDRDQDNAQWQHIPLQVPWFSDIELPLKEPAHLYNYSIGEEISTSAPIALGWSPPGLAKYRRCALGVLTANLVLSIWAAHGKPQLNSNWRRTLVVNHALGDYFHNAAVDAGYAEDDFEEQVRIRKRIRMFAWAPPLPSGVQNYSVGSRLSYGQHMIAMSNDDNHLVIAMITSPASTYGDEQGWNAKVLTHFALESVVERTCSKPVSLSRLLGQQRSISKIAWSPWVKRSESSRSIIVYATNEDVRARVIILSNATVHYGNEVVYPDIEMRYSGLLKWSPVVDPQDRLTLALFASKGLVYLRISIEDGSIVERMSHDLDGRWDQVTGAVWDTGQYPSPHLHFSSLLSTINNTTSSLKETHSGLHALETPSWRDQIENSAALFSVRNDLRGNSKVKVWGLATAPLQNFVATCSSVHPSDMVEYGSPSDRRSTVAVSALRKYSQMRKDFPAVDVSAEGILFTLKKLVENAIEKADDILPFSKEMVEKLILTYQPVESTSELLKSIHSRSDDAILESLVLNFKVSAVFNSHTLRDRFTILVSLACDMASSTTLAKTLIAYRLATVSQDLCHMLPHRAFSAEILQHHKQATSLISAVIGLKPPFRLGNEASLDGGGSAINTSLQTTSPAFCSDIEMNTTDTCDFCTAPIPFTDLFSAACSNGHRFPRCGLSMLAIQAPGTTKYCGICNTPFLSEEYVKLQDNYEGTRSSSPKVYTAVENDAGGERRKSDVGFPGGGQTIGMQRNGIGWAQRRDPPSPDGEACKPNQEKPPVSLARVLFLACDTCIYCGGHFM